MNLFIGIVVNPRQSLHWEAEEARRIDLETHTRAESGYMVELLEDLHAKVVRRRKKRLTLR